MSLVIGPMITEYNMSTTFKRTKHRPTKFNLYKYIQNLIHTNI